MLVASGSVELWRRVALLVCVLSGLGMVFYVAPAMVSITAIDWQQEQADELKSYSAIISNENKRLNQLPLSEYINEKTAGRLVTVEANQLEDFFRQVLLASMMQYDTSPYSNRVSEEDKDSFWQPQGSVEVFFKPSEIPFYEWGLFPEDGDKTYIKTNLDGQITYMLLHYYDYRISISAMSKPYKIAPSWLYHPCRKLGQIVLLVGVLIYFFLPRRKKQPSDISYSTGSMIAGDIVALILLLTFYGLPFLINGGTVQVISGLWPITIAMWLLAFLCIMLFYYNAWYASYRLELTPEALYHISFKGVREYRFKEMTQVNIVTLRNPGWFRKLSLVMAFLSIMGGRTSTQPAGSALLTASASYSGLKIQDNSVKPLYIWFTNQNGGVTINNFDLFLEAIKSAGVHINQELQEVEGFSMFM